MRVRGRGATTTANREGGRGLKKKKKPAARKFFFHSCFLLRELSHVHCGTGEAERRALLQSDGGMNGWMDFPSFPTCNQSSSGVPPLLPCRLPELASPTTVRSGEKRDSEQVDLCTCRHWGCVSQWDVWVSRLPVVKEKGC